MASATTSRITKTPGVCGGRACIAGHRVTVWGLVRWRQLGLTDAQILEAVPTINPTDLEAAWEYYASNQAEIERDTQENEDDCDDDEEQ